MVNFKPIVIISNKGGISSRRAFSIVRQKNPSRVKINLSSVFNRKITKRNNAPNALKQVFIRVLLEEKICNLAPIIYSK